MCTRRTGADTSRRARGAVDITQCSHTATVGRPDATALATEPVTITTAPLHGNVKGLFVLVQQIDGNPFDESFHLVVTC